MMKDRLTGKRWVLLMTELSVKGPDYSSRTMSKAFGEPLFGSG
ncbi:MAG: hypothetical protein WD425_14800 [Nitrospirales bacterium]